MKIFFLRLFFILAMVFLELSFLDILFPEMPAPPIVITGIVAFGLISEFSQALFMILPLALFFDIISSGKPGALSLFAVPLAYATSFLSRRILMSHRGWGIILYALVSGAAVFSYVIFNFAFFQKKPFFEFFQVFSFGEIFSLFFLAALLFTGIYPIILRFEKYLNSLSQRDFGAKR